MLKTSSEPVAHSGDAIHWKLSLKLANNKVDLAKDILNEGAAGKYWFYAYLDKLSPDYLVLLFKKEITPEEFFDFKVLEIGKLGRRLYSGPLC